MLDQKTTNLKKKKIATTCTEEREGGENRFEKSAEEHLF